MVFAQRFVALLEVEDIDMLCLCVQLCSALSHTQVILANYLRQSRFVGGLVKWSDLY